MSSPCSSIFPKMDFKFTIFKTLLKFSRNMCHIGKIYFKMRFFKKYHFLKIYTVTKKYNLSINFWKLMFDNKIIFLIHKILKEWIYYQNHFKFQIRKWDRVPTSTWSITVRPLYSWLLPNSKSKFWVPVAKLSKNWLFNC